MKKKRVVLDFGNKSITIEAEVCKNVFSQARGLTFRSRESAPALFFPFSGDVREPIHSLFVFFPFVAIWLNEKGKVVEIRKVKPFRFYVCPKKKFRNFVEIPLNGNYKKIVDDIEKFKYNK